jgi:hypothetical protein
LRGDPAFQNSARKSSRETVLGNYADKLSKAGWSLGWVSAIDSEGRTLWIVDAHRDDESVSSHVRMKR